MLPGHHHLHQKQCKCVLQVGLILTVTDCLHMHFLTDASTFLEWGRDFIAVTKLLNKLLEEVLLHLIHAPHSYPQKGCLRMLYGNAVVEMCWQEIEIYLFSSDYLTHLGLFFLSNTHPVSHSLCSSGWPCVWLDSTPTWRVGRYGTGSSRQWEPLDMRPEALLMRYVHVQCIHVCLQLGLFCPLYSLLVCLFLSPSLFSSLPTYLFPSVPSPLSRPLSLPLPLVRNGIASYFGVSL